MHNAHSNTIACIYVCVHIYIYIYIYIYIQYIYHWYTLPVKDHTEIVGFDHTEYYGMGFASQILGCRILSHKPFVYVTIVL